MERDERNIYIKGIALCAVFIILAVYLYTLPVRAKKGAFEASDASGEYFIAEEAETAKTGQIRESTASGMPCENPEQFERWLETYEQEASEETEKASDEERSNIHACETDSAAHLEEDLPTDAEMETEAETETAGVPQKAKCYSINGEVLNPELQTMMYDALSRHGISYFFEIACVQCYQESHFNVWAENPNGRDKGILQYRLQYWDWNRGDIFDPAAQIELYAEQMAQRLNSGLSADECISRHNTSDFVTTVNWEYVAQVKQHLANLREVK